MPGWFGVEATAGEKLNWAARREAAKRVRASETRSLSSFADFRAT